MELRESFENGHIVARLTDHHWAGISPDRAIESTLMAGIYICDLNLIGMIVHLDLNMKEITGCRHITSDKHEIKQVRHSAVSRYTEDTRKFFRILCCEISSERRINGGIEHWTKNVTSGRIAPGNVSIHKAEEIGKTI